LPSSTANEVYGIPSATIAFLNGFTAGSLAGENQLDAAGILWRHDGQPPELADRHLGLLIRRRARAHPRGAQRLAAARRCGDAPGVVHTGGGHSAVASAALASLVLHVVLALYLIQALLKMAVHFFVPYETRRKRIDAIYTGRQIALYDAIVLLLMFVFVGLLVAAGGPGYLSFITGLVVGMTLIQVYFTGSRGRCLRSRCRGSR
jgi:hypothetical protein